MGKAGAVSKFQQSFIPILHTSCHTLLNCISKQILIKNISYGRFMSIFTYWPRQSVLPTNVLTIIKCISMQNLIKIYHAMFSL